MSHDLNTPFELKASAIEEFRRDGFIQLRGVLSAETVEQYGPEITRLTLQLNDETRPLQDRDTYDAAFLQVMNLWRHSETVAAFVFSRRLAGIAAGLLGVQGVRLYHDQSLCKEPGGGITPAHADQYYWPLAGDKTVTAWIPLQDVPPDMGPLEFYVGSHAVTIGRNQEISDESERLITAEMHARGLRRHAQAYALGDVSFHSGWTFHRAGANVSARLRSVMTVIYMDRDIRLLDHVPTAARKDWQRWCAEATQGGPVATPLNPVLYP